MLSPISVGGDGYTEVAMNDDHNGSCSYLSASDLLDGLYYIHVADSGNDDTGRYMMEVKVTPPVCGPCGPSQVICCNSTVSGSNSGGTQLFDEYGVCGAYDQTGPEVVYRLVVPWDNMFVTAHLTNMTADLDIIVLQDLGSGCSGELCVAHHDNYVVFDANQYACYYLVVDGYMGATSGFDLTVTCNIP